MSIKKLTLISIFLSIMPVASFAAISDQDRINFSNTYGSEIDQKTTNKIFGFCEKNNNMDIDSCLSNLKAAQPSEQKPAQSQVNYSGYCCLNVSNVIGEYAYIHGQAYCIPPC